MVGKIACEKSKGGIHNRGGMPKKIMKNLQFAGRIFFA